MQNFLGLFYIIFINKLITDSFRVFSCFHHPPLPSSIYPFTPLPSSKMAQWSSKAKDRRTKKEKEKKKELDRKKRCDKAKRLGKKKDLKKDLETGTVSCPNGLRGPPNQKKPDAKWLLREAFDALWYTPGALM